MNTEKLGPLRVHRVVVQPDEANHKGDGEPPLTVILLHGFGAPGDDLVGLAASLGAPPGTTLLFPEAPKRVSDFVLLPFMGNARAWWMIDIRSFERAIAGNLLSDLVREVPEGLDSARDDLSKMIDALERQGTPSSRIVLGGFSQGSMLATDFVLRDARSFRGLVIFSGTLIAEDEWRPRMQARAGLAVFQSHGNADPILPYGVATTLRRELEGAGLNVTFSPFAGGHTIAPSVLHDFRVWLRALVAC
ncbi:MAG: dienelactone hydrolase family protein [Polyangiaceae bacterium]|nr:dienelactone hydrolase family protein [Polyangiaceae bacterium]